MTSIKGWYFRLIMDKHGSMHPLCQKCDSGQNSHLLKIGNMLLCIMFFIHLITVCIFYFGIPNI